MEPALSRVSRKVVRFDLGNRHINFGVWERSSASIFGFWTCLYLFFFYRREQKRFWTPYPMYIYDKHSFVITWYKSYWGLQFTCHQIVKKQWKTLTIPAEKQYVLCSVCRVQDAIGEKLSLGNNLQLSSNQTWLLKSAHLQGRPFEATDLSGIHVSLQLKFARILISGQTIC